MDSSERDKLLSLLEGLGKGSGVISILGSMNADYTMRTSRLPKPGETVSGGPLQLLPGGKSSNQAAAAAKLGAKTRLFGCLGMDDNASFLKGSLEDAGVDTSAISSVEGPSGCTLITVDDAGENTIVYSAGANSQVDEKYVRSVEKELLAGSVLGLCLESPLDAVCLAARTCHGAGIPVLLNDSPFVADLPEELVGATDVLLVNEHELSQLVDVDEKDFDPASDDAWSTVAAELAKRGFAQAIVTLGAKGSVVIDDGKIERVSAYKVDAVDTTGCGDAFMGAVLAGLASGYSLADSARIGSVVSAYAACGFGAQASYGSLDEIAKFISE